MVEIRKYEIPAVYAAFGAAISFYLFPLAKKTSWAITGSFVFLLIVISFLAVLAATHFIVDEENKRLKKNFSKVFALVIASAIGCTIGLAARVSIPSGPALGLETERVISISGVLKEDPRLFNDGRGMGRVALSNAGGSGGVTTSAHGNITVFFPPDAIDRIMEFGRGCEIYAEGKIVISRDGSLMFRSSAVFITKSASSLERLRGSVRAKLLTHFAAEDGPKWGGLASALLLGVRDNLDNDLTAAFRDAGCAHVLALSGMHLALVSGILAFFLRRIVSFRMALIIGGLFIIVYVFIGGGQPSLVRAAITYILGAVCVLGFLKKDTLNLLCLAFVLQMISQAESAVSPAFILSYLALFGIFTLGEAVHDLFRGRVPEIAGSSLAASIGAFISTLPVIALFFGIVNPIGLISGLVIVPLASLFLIIALAAMILLFPFPALFPFFDFLLSNNYSVIETIVSFAGKAPAMKVEPGMSLIVCIVLTAIIIILKKIDAQYRGKIVSFGN